MVGSDIMIWPVLVAPPPPLVQQCHSSARKHAQGAEVRLTSGSRQDTAHPACDKPNTSRHCALGAGNVYLIVRKPGLLHPGIVRMRWSYDYGHA